MYLNWGAYNSISKKTADVIAVSKADTLNKSQTTEKYIFIGDTIKQTFEESCCLTPFNKESNFNHYSIRFKILPWISIPSGSGINPTFGLEYGFCKNHSIGINLYYNQYSFSSGDLFDSTKNQYVPKPRVSNRDKAIFLNYRCYLGFQKIRRHASTAFYIGSFFRYGTLTFKYDEGYKNKPSIFKENHYSMGIMYGLVHQLACSGKGRQLNIDTYFGIYAKQKVQYIEYMDAQNNLVQDKDFPVTLGIRIGLSLNFTSRR